MNSRKATGFAVGAVVFFLLAGSVGADVASNLAIHYTFDKTAGDTILDASGCGNTGKLFNGSIVDAPMGKAVKFTKKSKAYIELETVNGIDLAGDMTFIAWVRIDADPFPDSTTNWTLIDCETYKTNGFVLRVSGSASNCFYRASQQDRTQSGSSTTKLDNRQWYQVGFTRQGETVKLYCDGRLENTRIVPQPVSPKRPLTIGSRNQSFVGCIDDVKLYNQALTNEQIAAQFKEDAPFYNKLTD